METERPPFGIYLHWPFCQAKCPYCDFNSHVAASVDEARWARAFRAEITRAREELGERLVSTVFFGGGTPSLMSPELVGHCLADIRAAWPVANDLEVTLEANPTSVESGRFRGYVEAGVTRFSIGLQSLEDRHLKALGRLHSASEGLAALETAMSVCDRVSADLIYARQHQGLAEWQSELAHALALGTDHLSLYQLTIEDGTAFGDRFKAGGLRGLPGEDLQADMYQLTQEMTERAGLLAYETSNHARDGAECRHNLIYWRGGEYLGLGPGAHGRIRVGDAWHATVAHAWPAHWLTAVETRGSGTAETEALSAADRATEYLMMSLRLREGSDVSRLPDQSLNQAEIAELVESGHLWKTPDRIGTTARGRPLLNSILGRLLA